MCKKNGIVFIDSENISNMDLYQDGLRLLERGKCLLANNFVFVLNNFLNIHTHYIQGNVAKHSGKCPQTFRGMSPNIPGNVAEHSVECPQIFGVALPNIPGTAAKHSGDCPQTVRGMFVLLKGMRTLGQSKISWNL